MYSGLFFFEQSETEDKLQLGNFSGKYSKLFAHLCFQNIKQSLFYV